jgi:hypothetical protein
MIYREAGDWYIASITPVSGLSKSGAKARHWA